MYNSPLAHNLTNIIAISKAKEYLQLDSELNLPQIIVFGSMHAGKSSILEKLINFQYLPRGQRTNTPIIQFHFHYVEHLLSPYIQINNICEDGNPKKITDLAEVRRYIETEAFQFSWKKSQTNLVITLNIFSSCSPSISIIDLPGYNHISTNPPSVQSGLINDKITAYLSNPHSIILAVFSANMAFYASHNRTIDMIREVDPDGRRTLSCLTKIDIMERGANALNLLRNIEPPFQNGFVGLKNRSSYERFQQVSLLNELERQESFFRKHPIYKDVSTELWGTRSLARKLTMVIYKQIRLKLTASLGQISQRRKASRDEIQNASQLEYKGQKTQQIRQTTLKLNKLEGLIISDQFFTNSIQNNNLQGESLHRGSKGEQMDKSKANTKGINNILIVQASQFGGAKVESNFKGYKDVTSESKKEIFNKFFGSGNI